MVIVIHNIGNNRYAYHHYRDGKKIISKYVGPVDSRGRIRGLKQGAGGVDRVPVGTTSARLKKIYAKAVKKDEARKAKKEPHYSDLQKDQNFARDTNPKELEKHRKKMFKKEGFDYKKFKDADEEYKTTDEYKVQEIMFTWYDGTYKKELKDYNTREKYEKIVKERSEEKKERIKRREMLMKEDVWKDKLTDAGLEEKHERYTGHKDFSKGMRIILERKDKSKVGKVYKYKDEGYDEEHIIEEDAVTSDVFFGKDFWGEGKEGKYAQTSATGVAPDLRGKGIGTALVKHQEDIAREKGIKKYYITHVNNKEFWSKMGYKQDRPGSQRTFSKIL